MSSSGNYFTPESGSSEANPDSSAETNDPVVLTARIRRRRLSKGEVKHLLARRYGSLTDFSQVVAT